MLPCIRSRPGGEGAGMWLHVFVLMHCFAWMSIMLCLWFFPFFIHRNICRNSRASLLLSIDNLRNSKKLLDDHRPDDGCDSDRGVIAFCVILQSRANFRGCNLLSQTQASSFKT